MNITDEDLSKGSESEERTMTKAIFVLTACLTLIGNVMVFLLFVRFPKWLKKAHNQCILNLAITDILTAISLLLVPKFVHDSDVYPVPSNYVFRELYCRIVWSHFLPFALGITSVYTCLVFAIERWIAVFRPIRYRQKFGVGKMRVLILCSWLAGFTLQSPVIVRVAGFDAKMSNDTTTAGCKWVNEPKITSWTLAIMMFAGETLIPCSLMLALYLHVFNRLRQGRVFLKSARTSSMSRNSVTPAQFLLKRSTSMMAMASLVLVLCWTPNQIYFLLAQLGYFELKASIPVWVVGVLVFCNSWMNPLIYAFMNNSFRNGYRELFISC